MERSNVWGDGKFQKVVDSSTHQTYAVCSYLTDGKKCGKRFSRKKGESTGNLRYHLKSAHKLIIGLNTNNENTNCAQEQEISKFFNFEDTSYKAAICGLVSIDNIPLSLLAKSNDLKKLLKYRFNESHQSPNSIRKILFEYFKKMREQGLFSLILDEWTGCDKRRFLNINIVVHSKSFNLGLIRIFGKATSLNLLNLINLRLQSFGLSLSDIAVFISDGAAVMVCLAKMANKKLQLCFLHGIHLAVTKVN